MDKIHQCKVEKEEYEIIEEKWSCPIRRVKTTNRAIHPVLGSTLQREWGTPVRIPSRDMRNDLTFLAQVFGHICMSYKAFRLEVVLIDAAGKRYIGIILLDT